MGTYDPASVPSLGDSLYVRDRANLVGQGYLATNMASPTFPSQSVFAQPVGLSYPIREDYKDEDEWYKAFVRYCATKAIPTHRRRAEMYRMAIDMYTQVSQFSKVPTYGRGQEDAGLTPVEYEFINAFAPIINVKQGEFSTKDYKVSASVSNERAFSRRAEFERTILTDKMLNDIDPGIFERMGQMPENPAALDAIKNFEGSINDFVEKNYRDIYADIAERLLTDWMASSNFENWLGQTYKFYQLTETAISCPYINERTLEVINPLIKPDAFVPDPMSRDNFFETANFHIEFQYESIESIRMRYPGIDLSDLKRLIGANRNFYGLPVWREDGDGRYYLVVMHVEFKYPEVNKFNEDFQVGTEIRAENTETETIIWEEPIMERIERAEAFEELYFVDAIGGTLIADKGRVPFQTRSALDPYKANLSSEVVVYDYAISPFIPNSSVRIGALINYRNLSLFKLLKLIGNLEGSKIVLDERLIPDFNQAASKDEAFATWWGNVKENNIIFTDSRETSMLPSGSQIPIQVINLSERDVPIINQLIETIAFIDQQIEKFMGFSPARTGNISKYAPVRNVQQELSQSDFATADLRNTFETFVERTLTKVVNLIKTAIIFARNKANEGDKDAELYLRVMTMRYGEPAMLVQDDFIFEDLGIKIKRRSNNEELMRDYKELGMLFLQQKVDPEAAEAVMDMWDSDDARDMRHNFKKAVAAQRARQQQQQQQQAMQEQEAAMQAQQAQVEGEAALLDRQQQMAMEKEMTKQDGETTRTLIKADAKTGKPAVKA
jgi:hypothetical protein